MTFGSNKCPVINITVVRLWFRQWPKIGPKAAKLELIDEKIHQKTIITILGKEMEGIALITI